MFDVGRSMLAVRRWVQCSLVSILDQTGGSWPEAALLWNSKRTNWFDPGFL